MDTRIIAVEIAALEEGVVGAGGFVGCFGGLFFGGRVLVPAAGLKGEAGIRFAFESDLKEGGGDGGKGGTGLVAEWEGWNTH